MNYVKGFDTVRAFAVLFVIISHWGPFFHPGTVPNKIMRDVIPSGQFGVTLFFVLSGFLITSILLKERIKNLAEGGTKTTIIKSFFVRRSLRIFPIYYLTVIVLYLVGHPYIRQHMGYYLLYLGNILPFVENKVNPVVHLWSLAVEEQFYLVWPWVILFIRERYLKHVFIVAIIIGIVSKYVVMFVLHRDFAFLVINWFDAFGVGGLYAYLRLDESKYVKFDKGYIVALLLMLYVGWRITPIGGIPPSIIYTRTLDIMVSLGIIIFVLNNKSAFLQKYLLENRFLNYLGKISYGLYLYHYVLEPFVWRGIHAWLDSSPGLPAAFHNFYFGYFLNYIVLFIVCWLSYTIIELPLLRLKKYFKYS